MLGSLCLDLDFRKIGAINILLYEDEIERQK